MVQEHWKQTETQIVNSLDVILTCNNGSFNFYHKPDDIIQYTNKESNHYPSIIKHLPASIEKRLSNISSDEKILTEAAIYYENTLDNASYTNKLVYHTPSASNQENKNKNHQRNIIFFNPPYCKCHNENRLICFIPTRRPFPKKPHL